MERKARRYKRVISLARTSGPVVVSEAFVIGLVASCVPDAPPAAESWLPG